LTVTVDVTDRHREGVSDIVRTGHAIEAQQQLDHPLYLQLLRTTVSHHGTLDLSGGVLHDLHARFDRRQHRHASRMAQLQRASDVHRVKEILDDDVLRMACGDEGRELVVNGGELVCERRRRRRANGAAEHEPIPPPIAFDAAVARALRSRVDAEHPHVSEASISFSAMSKFDHTCCTSS
jgi:hypothetical protein